MLHLMNFHLDFDISNPYYHEDEPSPEINLKFKSGLFLLTNYNVECNSCG